MDILSCLHFYRGAGSTFFVDMSFKGQLQVEMSLLSIKGHSMAQMYFFMPKEYSLEKNYLSKSIFSAYLNPCLLKFVKQYGMKT